MIDGVRYEPRPWSLLTDIMPEDQVAGYMLMGESTSGIVLFKHGVTRVALNLARSFDGAVVALRRNDDAWERTDIKAAVEAVYADLDGENFLGATRTTSYDGFYRARRDAAVEQIGWRSETVSAADGPDEAARQIDGIVAKGPTVPRIRPF